MYMKEKYKKYLEITEFNVVKVITEEKEIIPQIIFNYMGDLYLEQGYTGKLTIL